MKSIATHEGENGALRTGEGARLMAVASRAFAKGSTAAKQVAARTRDRADHLMFDTTRSIKRDPLRAVGVSFATGFGLAALTIFVALRRLREYTF